MSEIIAPPPLSTPPALPPAPEPEPKTTPPTTYKLTYFPVKALAEPIRFLLRYAGVEFEDVGITKEHWPEIKNSMPFGQLPVLEMNGKIAHQSIAICRYLAKQSNLMGTNDWENLEIDSIVDSVSEFRQKVSAYFIEKDGEIRAARKKVLVEETLPFYMGKLEEAAIKNNGYLACGRLTWADLFFVGLLDYFNAALETDILNEHPRLQEVKRNVLALPAINEWIQTRPESDY
uniref:glutathione transferase n=1 Tax=Lasioderma serricorne TaxID=295660 RepID=A0A2I6SQL0_9COLE|nr:glutathione S-transferase sigma [Lasioderma serricorne]QWV59558.1 glutathione S-transferase sigma 1 [Lasioderma serricorne]